MAAGGNFTLNDLLEELKKDYNSSTKYNWLRCILHGILSVNELSPEQNSASQLFLPLHKTKGLFSETDVEILLEIAKLTEQKSAITHIEEYKKNTKGYNGKRVERITPFRKALFGALKNVGRKELADITAFYYKESGDFATIWDFVFYLETHEDILLDSTREKTERFAKLLNGIAKSKLQKYADTLPVTAEPQNIPSPSIPEVLPGTAAVDRESTSAVLRTPTEVPADGNSEPWTSSGIELTIDDYRKLLVDVSSWWDDKVNLLKFIIFKFKSDVTLTDLQRNNDPFVLFELLRSLGKIGPSNVDVLIAALAVGKVCVDEKKIKHFIPTFPGFIKIKIPASWDKRQKLVNFGRGIGEAEQTRIEHLYGLKKLDDVWTLMFELENKGAFDGEMTDFVQTLRGRGLGRLAKLLE